MGYEFYPQALGGAIRRAWKSTGGVPILVTENGIATVVDEGRIAFMKGALQAALTCLSEGIDLRIPELVAVDRRNFARRPKPSAHWFGAVARARELGDAQ